MVTSAAKSGEQYLSELPQDRREMVSSVREIPAVSRAIASMPPDVYIAQHEASRAAAKKAVRGKSTAAGRKSASRTAQGRRRS